MEQKKLVWNVELWKWYFNDQHTLITDEDKSKTYDILTMASSEDIKLFTRFVMYVSNTRNKNKEIEYKTLCYFLSLLFPDFTIANLDIILKLGKKSDILYYMPTMPERLMTWIKHKANEDKDFEILMTGEYKQFKIDRKIRYKPLKTKDYKWSYFFEKLASDSIYNGLISSEDFNVLEEYNKELI